MVGSAEIKKVIKLPVSDIWKHFGRKAQIERTEFDDYFAGLQEGFALQISNPRSFTRAIRLSELRDRFGFEPPQSFLYVAPLLRMALQDEYSNLSH
jgi:predicted transcriptional regulator